MSRSSWARLALFVVCVVVLAGHLFGDHARAAFPEPSSVQSQGQAHEHHQSAIACDGVQPSGTAIAAAAACDTIVTVLSATRLDVHRAREVGPVRPAPPPLFLLHSALLI